MMWLSGKSVLHIVDIDTSFSSAAIVKGQTVEDVWRSFVMDWCSLYPGYPETLRVDQGSCFTSIRWERLAEMVGINNQKSGVESHNSIGNGERYHSPLRRIFNKINHDQPSLDFEYALRLSVKSMNDTMGPNGLVPSFLVFGTLPRFPFLNTNLPNQREILKALQVGRA